MTVHIDQVRVAYAVLGLCSDEFDNTRAVGVSPKSVTHELYPEGTPKLGLHGGVITESVEYDISRDGAGVDALKAALADLPQAAAEALVGLGWIAPPTPEQQREYEQQEGAAAQVSEEAQPF